MSGALVLAGLAIAGPSILGSLASSRSVPITPYVTTAHVAAMAELKNVLGFIAPPTADQRAHSRLLSVLGFHRTLAGPAKSLPLSAYCELNADQADKLCTDFVRACQAGVAAGGYEVASVAGGLSSGPSGVAVDILGGIIGLPFGVVEREAKRTSVVTRLFGAHPSTVDDGELTALGRACKRCILEGGTASLGGLVDGFDTVPAQRAASNLAIEMDAVGHLIFGKPPDDPTVIGGIKAAGGAVADWATDLPGNVASLAAGGLANLALSTPGMIAIAGFFVWRVMR